MTTVAERKFEARYPGRCPACEDAIEVGDDLAYDEDVVVHFVCVGRTATHQAASKKPREVCPRCFTQKSVSGACICEDDQ